MSTTARSMSRSSEDIFEYLDKKFENLKNELKSDFKNDIMVEISRLFEQRELKIEKLESQVAMLQQHISTLKQQTITKTEELEQYGRRLCLRIDGVPTAKCETAEDALNSVKSEIEESGLIIPEVVLDRAHRIGKTYIDSETNEEKSSVIVRFTTFRHRTMVYKQRKQIKNVKIRLDLTKVRFSLLMKAREKIENNDKVKFVYADINCRLRLHPTTGKDCFFDTLEDLEKILVNLN